MQLVLTMISQALGLPGMLAISLESPGDEDDTSVGVRRAGSHSELSKLLPNLRKFLRISGPAEEKNQKN